MTTEEQAREVLEDRLQEVDDGVRRVCQDPDVVAALGQPLLTLVELRTLVDRRYSGGRPWSAAEQAQVVRFLGDLVHDVELVRELLAFPVYIGRPKVLREERLG